MSQSEVFVCNKKGCDEVADWCWTCEGTFCRRHCDDGVRTAMIKNVPVSRLVQSEKASDEKPVLDPLAYFKFLRAENVFVCSKDGCNTVLAKWCWVCSNCFCNEHCTRNLEGCRQMTIVEKHGVKK